MKDRFGRNIDYLRLSVIDRCNLRCQYCHDGDYNKVTAQSLISYEEIALIAKHLKTRGLKEIKITGGEPLLRKDLPVLINKLVEIGLSVSLTTNGVMLSDEAQKLYDAGLKRINIGVDCLDGRLFEKITGFDQLEKVKEGLFKAFEVGFKPIKINVVLIKGLNEDIEPWLDLVKENPFYVRFIEVMQFVNGFKPISNTRIKEKLEKIGSLSEVFVKGRGPAKHYQLPGFKGGFGFISPTSDSFCNQCSRIRLDAQGKIRSCLFTAQTFDFLGLVRNGFSEDKLDGLIDNVLDDKPSNNVGLKPNRNMCQIGG